MVTMKPAIKFVRIPLLLALLVAATGCTSSPTSPPAPTPVLSVSQATVALSRTETRQLTATSTVNGTGTDVTATGSWRSSNVQVATVAAGLITAVGPGTTTVTVEHAGQTQSVALTVRRRTRLVGEVRVETVGGQSTIVGAGLALDGLYAGGTGTSGTAVWVTTNFISTAVVDPGNHVVTVLVNINDLQPTRPTYNLTWLGPIRVLDLDTSEELTTIALPSRTVETTSDPQLIDWEIAVSAFTS